MAEQPADSRVAPQLRTQAQRIFDRFGVTAYGMAKLLHLSPSTVYRWNYAKDRGGTGGLVPCTAMRELISIARVEGVLLVPDDFDPRPK